MLRSLPWIIVAAGLLPAQSVLAQTHPLAKRVILVGENRQLRQRLSALDRHVAFLGSAGEVVKMVGWSAPAYALRPLAAMLLEQADPEKWDQLLEDYRK